jgi:hypothetical protein
VHQSFNRHKKKSKARREGDISDFPYWGTQDIGQAHNWGYPSGLCTRLGWHSVDSPRLNSVSNSCVS